MSSYFTQKEKELVKVEPESASAENHALKSGQCEAMSSSNPIFEHCYKRESANFP